MKVLIIGKNSWIGNHIDKWLTSKGWHIYQLDVLTDEWKTFNYTPYDAIVHVAGIVHQPHCKDWDLYKRVNTDMPIAIAKMAKSQGVKRYVFLSTMAVYGIGKKLKPNIINSGTPLHANSMYGHSKLLAEKGLNNLQDTNFDIVIVRPPSVYGKGCRGGYITGFLSAVQKFPVIPQAYVNVKQSMLYIDNLSEFVRLAIEHHLNGTFCIQDDKAVNANEICDAIAKGIDKTIHKSRLLGIFVKLFSFVPLVKKAYGGIEYAHNLSSIKSFHYVVIPFDEGMRRTVE